ncbi:hypothetical protein EVAR_23660_1 [Eumeta japonica]|uniref:Uncharacterized protein n=1 Tax=Eumeta variegata TaxID=151549 RepID=A0A4C1VKQ8_EUMVA|nr:hypothetical protein EVAR_23660_1 [Eumeta japonica]
MKRLKQGRQLQQIPTLKLYIFPGERCKKSLPPRPAHPVPACGLREGKNLICAFFAGPRCHKEFHFPLFIYLYFTDGSCSWAPGPPRAAAPPAPEPFFRLPRSQITPGALISWLVSDIQNVLRSNLS